MFYSRCRGYHRHSTHHASLVKPCHLRAAYIVKGFSKRFLFCFALAFVMPINHLSSQCGCVPETTCRRFIVFWTRRIVVQYKVHLLLGESKYLIDLKTYYADNKEQTTRKKAFVHYYNEVKKAQFLMDDKMNLRTGIFLKIVVLVTFITVSDAFQVR